MKHTNSELLGLIRVGQACRYSLDELKAQISASYPWFQVTKADEAANAEEAYDSRRNQYHSTRILALLEREIERLRVGRLLGVADFDLYVPGMNFVFGEARCPGRVGVISTHRLKPRSSNEIGLFQERVVKEAVHEIGHMLGLRHCTDELCAMHFSERLSDTDRKWAELCAECSAKLKVLEAE